MVGKSSWILKQKPNEVSNRYERMLSEEAIEKASLFLDEEQHVLESFLANNVCLGSMNCCVIGGGPFQYLLQVLSFAKSYTLIEPFLDLYVTRDCLAKLDKSSKIKYFNMDFETFCDTSTNVPHENTFYVFWFNVIQHINNPIHRINKIIKKGDIVFLSGWGDSNLARQVSKDYFTFVNDGFRINDPPSLPSLKDIELNKLKHIKDINSFRGKVADIRIINT